MENPVKDVFPRLLSKGFKLILEGKKLLYREIPLEAATCSFERAALPWKTPETTAFIHRLSIAVFVSIPTQKTLFHGFHMPYYYYSIEIQLQQWLWR
ncbi:MAG: hypothetical protein RR696_04515 [Clostridia bacterium]